MSVVSETGARSAQPVKKSEGMPAGPKGDAHVTPHRVNRRAIISSLRGYLLFALFVCIGLVGGLGGWAYFANISGAVVTSGRVVVESNVKEVQHREGGIIKSILVENGDQVEVGDILITLDDTVTRANLSVVLKQLTELMAQEARLVAERDGADAIEFNPPEDIDAASWEDVAQGQALLFEARRNSVSGRQQQLREQMRQYDQQIEGLQAQLNSKASEISLIKEELVDLSALLEKQLVAKSRVTALRREQARLGGQHGQLLSQIAQVREAISEREIQILQIEETYRADVLENLATVRSQIAQLLEQRIAAEDELRRIEIRAPQSGYVHQLAVHTQGGILGPGETAMLIVPGEDLLLVEAKVRPVDVDQLRVGQMARVRFPNFDARTTPELNASLSTVSADLSEDERTGEGYYTARLRISDEELEKLGRNSLVPGMPVEAFVTTEERSVLSYLVKPVVDQIAHAMREQ